MLAGFAFAGMAAYAGWSTRWLTEPSMAPLPAKIAAAVTIGLVTILSLAVIAVCYVAYAGLALWWE